jgi:hypothetical protein
MKMLKLMDATTVRVKDTWVHFPIWIDVDRVVCVSPSLQEQNYGGVYFTVDGTKIDFEGGQSVRVREEAEEVAELLGWQAHPA